MSSKLKIYRKFLELEDNLGLTVDMVHSAFSDMSRDAVLEAIIELVEDRLIEKYTQVHFRVRPMQDMCQTSLLCEGSRVQ